MSVTPRDRTIYNCNVKFPMHGERELADVAVYCFQPKLELDTVVKRLAGADDKFSFAKTRGLEGARRNKT